MEGKMEIIVYILISVLCYVVSGIVHELGHIIIGLMNGWKFSLFILGPLGLKVDENGHIKAYFEKRISLWGGVGGTFPKEIKEDNIKIWSKILLGGPLASIIMGAIFLPLGIIKDDIIFILLGVMPLAMGIVSILPIPLKTGILYTDGGRLIRLNKGGQEADEEIALFKLTEYQNIIGDFSKFDINCIDPLLKSKDISINYYGYYYKFQYYKEISDKEKMNFFIKKMGKIENKVSAVIIEDCKIE